VVRHVYPQTVVSVN